MMRQVRELYDNCAGYGYFATVPSSSHIVCAIFRGETALPDQLAIMYDTLRDMHLDSATHTYNVPVNENMPGNGTVVIISGKRASILPTVFVENRLVTKLEDMIPRSALEEALDLDTGQLRFDNDTGNPNDTTGGDDQSAGNIGGGMYDQGNTYAYQKYTLPVETDSGAAGPSGLSSYSTYGHAAAMEETSTAEYAQGPGMAYSQSAALMETVSKHIIQSETSYSGRGVDALEPASTPGMHTVPPEQPLSLPQHPQALGWKSVSEG
ncbi:hypothetical protein SPBR_08576 [Sporothrix brasiliensis 5110]|uniref:Uncharacterized protein n=1 Tax=Sporothrix brasiliensis 5110 TaxID=1398154 RepID=A0A0C2IBB0_9PEZI|nr:uncharacterized protein SPBR_08576 [Sporothrix brasiliensis 5110]KIH86536.1 hypothetical protein SPBR_08576 [Sporothrix brasiliensis 5110]